MIIEGKHKEIGSGIFISDIQEESGAQQAGLVVGDVILAVNKDVLIKASYDFVSIYFKTCNLQLKFETFRPMES